MTYIMQINDDPTTVLTIPAAATLRPLFEAAESYGATNLDATRTACVGDWTGNYRIVQVVITGPDVACIFRDPAYVQETESTR